MIRVLLGYAALGALTLATAPAVAKPLTGNPAAPADRFGVGPRPFDERLCREGRDDETDRPRVRCSFDSVLATYGGEWALYNNRSWGPDSYNDWWHDQPWRAYPAWMRRNHDCQRQWFSGDVLRC